MNFYNHNKNLKNQNRLLYLKENLRLNLFIGACVLFLLAMLMSLKAEAQVISDNTTSSSFIICPMIKKSEPLNYQEIKEAIGYPLLAKEGGIEGDVTLKILVNEDGCYAKHIVLKQVHPILLKAVEKQIRKLCFSPAIQGNNIVKYWTTVPFKFDLDEKPAVTQEKTELPLKEDSCVCRKPKLSEKDSLSAYHFEAHIGKKPQIVNTGVMDSIIKQITTCAIGSEIQGDVILKILIDKEGCYVNHLILKKIHPKLIEIIEKQVCKLQFTPAMQGKNPVRFWFVVPFKRKFE